MCFQKKKEYDKKFARNTLAIKIPIEICHKFVLANCCLSIHI